MGNELTIVELGTPNPASGSASVLFPESGVKADLRLRSCGHGYEVLEVYGGASLRDEEKAGLEAWSRRYWPEAKILPEVIYH
jgi:hypothetical protein